MPTKRSIDYDMRGIASVLSGDDFRVPIYQRSYAWKNDTIDDFWSDLQGSLDSKDHDYFLGTLVLTPAEEGKRLTIIDGQQRLATTSLLLAALRDIASDRGDKAQANDIQSKYLSTFDRRNKQLLPRLFLNEEDQVFFRELVVESKTPSPKRESHTRMVEALAQLKTQAKKDIDAHGKKADDRLIAWLDCLDEQALVITVTVPTEADAFVIFETLNDRGADLTIGDLLRNYLFGHGGKQLETVKSAWIGALGSLDISAENDVFVAFLRHHWSSKYGATRERELYREIKKRITSEAAAVEYAAELADAARHYAAIRSPSHAYWKQSGFTTSVRANVETLLRLDLEQHRPLLLAVMQYFSVAEVRKTLHSLVNWSVRGLIVGGIGGGRTETAYCNAAMKVRKGEIKSTNALLKELTAIVPDDKNFLAFFETARQTKPRISRYMLLALERHKAGDKEPELVPNENEDEVNLEHILPKNAKQADWPDFSSDEVSVWSNRIGNHCLLKKSQNELIGNKPWKTKKPILAKSQLALTKSAGTKKDWAQKEISARQKALAKLAVATWPRSL